MDNTPTIQLNTIIELLLAQQPEKADPQMYPGAEGDVYELEDPLVPGAVILVDVQPGAMGFNYQLEDGTFWIASVEHGQLLEWEAC